MHPRTYRPQVRLVPGNQARSSVLKEARCAFLREAGVTVTPKRLGSDRKGAACTTAKGGRAGGLTAAGAGGGGRAARAGKGAGAAGSVDSEHVQHIMGVSDQLALPHLLDHSKVVLLSREPKAPARSAL